MNLETELKAALKRQNPGPGFANRVVAATVPRKRTPMAVWAAAMAAMLVAGVAINTEYQHRRAERAGEQVMLALRITSEKLNAARAKVLRLDALENEDAPEKALEKGN
jgi:hypothetical protein